MPTKPEAFSGGVVPEPAFLQNADKSTAEEEQAALVAAHSAPRWMGKQAVEWAKAHPDDARVPEALHLSCVRAWRYGCTESSGESTPRQPSTCSTNAIPPASGRKRRPIGLISRNWRAAHALALDSVTAIGGPTSTPRACSTLVNYSFTLYI